MNKIENDLKTLIKKVIKETYDLDISDDILMIEIPKDNTFGDYSSNIAMRLSKQLKMKPLDIANGILDKLASDQLINKVEVKGPGFINFFVNKQILTQVINEIINAKEKYGHNNVGQGQKILFEYVSANPTGNLHVGHARCAAWGDSCARILKASAYDCLREYYINNAGNQMINLGKSIYARYLELFDRPFELPEDGYHGQDIIEIAKIIKDEVNDKYLDDPNYLEFFMREGERLELKKIEKDLEYYRCSFDSWFSERSLYEDGKVVETLNLLKEKGYTYEKDGALWFKTTEFGDDKDRVLIKNDGSYTYLTPDIANHLNKVKRGYPKLIDLLGADHHGYLARLQASMMALGYDRDTIEVDFVQMVRIIEDGKEVKMSKRTGNAITLRELCDDIGVDAARYFVLQRALDTHFDFDLALARKKSNENPVYYVQYAHARICSILKNIKDFKQLDSYELLTHEKEIDLIKYLNEYKDVVSQAALTRMPNKICNYVYKLATYFHSFYATLKVIDTQNEELTNQRVALLMATKITLANALDLLGVEALEVM